MTVKVRLPFRRSYSFVLTKLFALFPPLSIEYQLLLIQVLCSPSGSVWQLLLTLARPSANG